MSEIYKVNRVINNQISHIYVFVGDQEKTVEEIKGDGTTFSASELRKIDQKKIPIQIIKAYIHGDDTIQRIKEKIFKECSNIENSIPNAMYLFSITEQKYDSDFTFNNLTQNDTIDLTDNRLKQFLSNIVSNKDTIINKKISTFFKDGMKEDSYNYNQFNKLNIDWDSKFIFTQAIGQKLVIRKNYPFIANPYNNKIMDEFLKRTEENIISTQNAYLLFKYSPIKDNNIYLTLAKDVLNYASQNSYDEKYFFKLYFPILYKDIQSKASLEESELLLYNTEKSKINKYYKKINEKLDIFYNIWNSNPEYLNYTSIGISYIYLTLHPENSIKLPLEVLFKIVHSNTDIPLIKYNPGTNYENIYRLFTSDNISVSGIKIPSLFISNNNKKTKIMNISKTLSKRQSVGFYIEHKFKKQLIEIYCEFFEDGNIEIKFESEILLDIPDIQLIIKKAIDDTVLNTIRNYLKQSGYNYIKFKNITDDNIEINSLTYKSILKNKKKFDISKYVGCISSLFNVISGSASKTTDIVKLMYKRVNVFQVMDSIKGFITSRRQYGDTVDEILNLLTENFPKEISTRDKALDLFAEWQQEIQLMIDTRGEGKRIIESNPGFTTTITSQVFTNDTFSILTIENINDIRYLKYIKIYINSLFRIILKLGIKQELKEKIIKICKKTIKQQKIIDQITDIRADTEKTGPVRFDNNTLNMDDIEEASDLDLSDIEEDSDDDEEEEENDDEIEFGDEEIGFGDEEIEFGDEESNKEKSVSPADSELSLIDEDDEDDDSLIGGAKSGNDSDDDEDMEEDLTNLSISGANSIFTKRLKDNDPSLFLKKETPGYASYTRSCPNQYKRQPILITDEEKEYIDSEDRKNGISSYGESIRYGSGDKKFNYICPRFWCIKDPKTGRPRSLTLQQVNEGECGGWDAIIPEKTASGKSIKKVPRGKRIVELTDERFHREKSGIKANDPARKLIYRPMYPGFQDPSKHPKNKCIPCCFQTPFKSENYMGWKEGEQLPFMFKKDGSKLPPTDYLNEDGTINLKELEKKKYDNYRRTKEKATDLLCNEDGKTGDGKNTKVFDETPIFGFPLRKNQLGYMNDSLQKFLGFDNNICFTRSSASGRDKKLKQQQYCIVRLGIHKNKNQSFIELLGSVYNYYSSMKILPDQKKLDLNIKEIKKIFLDNLTIDKFVMVQNGILPKLFEKENMADIDILKYKTSKYLQNINDENYKNKIIKSYENFKSYINDEEEEIDYKYIWDFITLPMSKGGVLFENGINLLIFRNPDDDTVNKIELICPTNYYANTFFNVEKKTLMIYNKGSYFEPLCKIYKRDKQFQTVKFFSMRDYRVFANNSKIMDIIIKIKDIMKINCMAKKSIQKYDYERNISSNELMNILLELNYKIINQIMNYNNNVIGIVTRDKQKNYYIPCRPSSVIIDKTFIFSHDAPINEYEETKQFLKTLYIKSNKRIPCNIKDKLINDNMIIGIKTITNQVIPVIPISQVEGSDDIDEYIIYSGNDIMQNDSNVLISKTIDEEREKVVKSLELENNFYNLFRNTLKILLNKKINLDTREEILSIVESPVITYIEKTERIKIYVKKLLANVVNFIEFKLDILEDYEDMITCLGLDKSSCNNKKNIYCTFMRQNTCVLTLPKTNLYSNDVKNDVMYYDKIVDEIIRYSKIRKYLFTSREFLSFEYVNYRINHNEIILLEEILMDKYFDDLILRKDNKYINSTNIYDIINPIEGNIIQYSPTFTKDEILNINNKKSVPTWPGNIAACNINSNFSTEFKKSLTHNDMELAIESTKSDPNCSLKFIQKIINNHKSEKMSVNDIKNILIDQYLNLKMPVSTVKINKQDVSNWTVFSYVKWLEAAKNREALKENIISKPIEQKNEEIRKQINHKEYIITEFDLFLILNALNIPSIISMKQGQKFAINTTKTTFNTFKDIDEVVYIIIVTKIKINNNRRFSMANMMGSTEIPKSIINNSLLSGVKNINKFIKESLIFQKEKIEKKRTQDEAAQKNKREMRDKKIKKLGKKKLSSE